MKVKDLIKQLTDNADGDAEVHIQESEGTFKVTNILVSASAVEGSSIEEGAIILVSFANEE